MNPGGEAIEAVSTAASKAGEEAATGAWLRQLDSGDLPRIAAPGLGEGWSGPWQHNPPAVTPAGWPSFSSACLSDGLWESIRQLL